MLSIARTNLALRTTSLRTSALRPSTIQRTRRCMSSSSSMPKASQLVDTMISGSQSSVVMFSKSTCPYCDKAKDLLESAYPDVGVEVLETDEHPIGEEIREYLAEKTGQWTVPNIFIKQKHIGGSDDLVALHRSSRLSELLAELDKVPQSKSRL